MANWAGLGSGAAKGLEEILAERLVAKQLEQEIADRQQRFDLDQQRVNESRQQNEWERGRAEKLDAERATERQTEADKASKVDRGRSNMAGVLSMGLDPDTAKREIAYSSLQSGASVPNGVVESLTPQRDQLKDYEERKKIDQKYEKPAGPTRIGTHVVGSNLVDDNGRVLFTDPNKAGGQNVASPYAEERAGRTVQAVDELLGQVSRWNTGMGSMLSGVPESGARNFKGQLDTLKANIAFNELTSMREASKTGGALGAVSEREMELLQSALGALDQGQSPEQISAQLQKVKESVQRWQQAAGHKGASMQPTSSHAPTEAAPAKRFTITKVGG